MEKWVGTKLSQGIKCNLVLVHMPAPSAQKKIYLLKKQFDPSAQNCLVFEFLDFFS
jgi:hypothetical protein